MIARSLIAVVAALMISAVPAFSASGVNIGSLSCRVVDAVGKVRALWAGEIADPGPIAAVTGTAAIAMKLVGLASSQDEAQETAARLWRERAGAVAGSH